eukprot:3093420-Rhodomonas_salina.2
MAKAERYGRNTSPGVHSPAVRDSTPGSRLPRQDRTSQCTGKDDGWCTSKATPYHTEVAARRKLLLASCEIWLCHTLRQFWASHVGREGAATNCSCPRIERLGTVEVGVVA